MQIRQFPEPTEFARYYERHNVVPVCREILADTDTPVSVLHKIYDQAGPAFLFESVAGGERWGRYSFLSTSARTRVRLFARQVEIKKNGQTDFLDHHGNPLAVLRDVMKGYDAAEIPELPRFWGGLVGYFTYEMVSFFEAIANPLPPDRPLAHFMIPDEMLIFDNVKNTLIMVAITYRNDGASAAAAHDAAIERIDAMQTKIEQYMPVPDGGEQADADALVLQPLTEEAAYRSHVETVKSHIMAGDVIQTVISQPFTAPAPADPIRLYRAQRYINPSPYLYFMHLDDTVLVGSSPETMVRLENGVATLRPIAGTRPRGQTEQQDRAMADELLKDEKERAEHLMLVDLGRNDLGRVAETGTVQVTDLMIVERYSHVMHLVSNITCDLTSGLDAFDLLAATFPAGTLTGAPKIRAMEIIAELEDQARGPYGGAVGYISFDGNMDLAITIRTACVQDGRMTIRAGAGIVADSDPESERMETVNKAMGIQRALELLK